MGKLTDVAIRAAKAGRLQDGKGLFLEVRATGAKFWLLRTMKDGKRSEMGLGSYPETGLSAARAKADTLRAAVKAGVDVLGEKRAAAAKAKEAGERTFEKVARLAHAQRKPAETRTSEIWLGRLERFTFPALGDKLVDKVDGPMVIKALEPIWNEKPETARRVRRAISTVLKFAHSREWRGPVPVLSDLTKNAFPAHDSDVQHLAAVPHPKAPAIVAKLKAQVATIGRHALLFTIYTAARSGETRMATWGEIDLANALWSIPAARMKRKRDHVVPLSAPALAILEARAAAWREAHPGSASIPADALVFEGSKADRPISDMTMTKAHKLVAPGTVVHGWRSTFRDWAGEETDHSTDVCEAALAHLIGNATMRSYQRGTMLEKRRTLMDDWAVYLEAVGKTVD
jgi:integrase